jgi:hypothetical protein
MEQLRPASCGKFRQQGQILRSQLEQLGQRGQLLGIVDIQPSLRIQEIPSYSLLVQQQSYSLLVRQQGYSLLVRQQSYSLLVRQPSCSLVVLRQSYS